MGYKSSRLRVKSNNNSKNNSGLTLIQENKIYKLKYQRQYGKEIISIVSKDNTLENSLWKNRTISLNG